MFDVQAALDEILSSTIATPATSAALTSEPPCRSRMSRMSQPLPAKNGGPAEVLSFPAQANSPILSDGEPEYFPHGRCKITGKPQTWTGKVVSLAEWRALSDWDRHGSTGKLWNGLTRQWEPSGNGE